MKTMKIKKTAGERFFDGFNIAFLFLFTLLMLYPIIYVFAISLSSAQAVDQGGFFLWPRDFSLDAYRVVFSEPNMGRSYLNTVFYAFTNTFLGMAFTSMLAYALSVQDYVLKKPITVMLTITMFISGGLIPGYLLNKALHLIDTVWVMIIPGISAYNVVLYRTFFQGNAMQLREAAMIDGAGEFRIYLRIVTPLSIAIYATLGLFSLVGNWNGWFGAMIYLRREELFPYQLLLRRILDSITTTLQRANQGDDEYLRQAMKNSRYNARNIQMAAIFIGMAPILCVYPFVQKYFVKGVFVGSIKG
ncbi:MAG: carbohydrate ABC transporter permease [Clostridiales bacterium]|nr:carbohydrate ABC transporter permease [Clostridiales bacterium]MDY2872509.1 carbohydrate ABC transporter permease [Eubacteriales bacterium]